MVGAVWTRIMDDYGHVDDETPSFAISLYKEYRGQGIGSQLMVKMLELLKWRGYERTSLAVQKENYAVKCIRMSASRRSMKMPKNTLWCANYKEMCLWTGN